MQTQTRPRDRPRQRPSATAADKRFSKYRREDHKLVRKPDVNIDLPRDLRKRREMLRAMTPEQVLAVIEFYRDLDFFQALELAKSTGKLIVPHDVHDRILTEIDDSTYLEQLYPARTGTLVIYEKPDKPFGRSVEFEGITFEVPKQFRGRANCALAVDHPDWDVVGDELKVPDPSTIHLVGGFPRKDGCYMSHDKNLIPHGNEVAESDEARYLWRVDNSSYISSVARNYGFGYGRTTGSVLLGYWPSGGFGVALF